MDPMLSGLLAYMMIGMLASLLASLIGGDEHYGTLGFGNALQTTVDVFTVSQFDTTAEPDIIVKAKKGGGIFDIIIEDIMVWDTQYYEAQVSIAPELAGSEDSRQLINGGITKDNTENATDGPTSDIVAQGTFPGGDQAGVLTGVRTGGDETPRYEARFAFLDHTNEQNAAGVITVDHVQMMRHDFNQYTDAGGNTFFHLMTARHYHMWLDASNTDALGQLSLGGYVRRVSVDLKEVLFDRSSIIGLIEALQALS